MLAQHREASVFGQLNQKDMANLLASPIEYICHFQITGFSQKIQCLAKFDGIYQFQVRSSYLLQWDSTKSTIVSGTKLSYLTKIQAIQQSQLVNFKNQSPKQVSSFKITFKTINQAQLQNEQSNFFELQPKIDIYFTGQQKNIYDQFIKILVKKQIILQISDLREYYKPSRLIQQNVIYKVYQAVQLKGKQKVAIKTFPKESWQNRLCFIQIMNQLKLLSQLKSPYVLKLLRVFCTKNTLYLVFQAYDISLHQMLQFQHNALWTQKRIKGIVYQLIDAICDFRSQNIIHRQFNAKNILIKNYNSGFQSIYIANFIESRHCIDLAYGKNQQDNLTILEPTRLHEEADENEHKDVQALSKIILEILSHYYVNDKNYLNLSFLDMKLEKKCVIPFFTDQINKTFKKLASKYQRFSYNQKEFKNKYFSIASGS